MLSGFPNLAPYEDEVSQLNLSFLQLCRDLARHDKALAAEKFGVSAHFVDRISRATTEDLRELAKNKTMIFQPRSSIGLDIVLGAILAPGVTSSQVEGIRTAAMLTDNLPQESVA